MSPLLAIAIPVALTMIGIILHRLQTRRDGPQYCFSESKKLSHRR